MTFRSALLLMLPLLAAAPSRALAEIEYDTTFKGVDEATESELRLSSQLVALVDKHPETLAALRRRADGDLARLKQVLEAEGYYDAGITDEVVPDPGHDDSATVTVTVQPGQRYTLAEVTLRLADGGAPPEPERFEPARLDLAIGGPARSAPIVAAEATIAHNYALRGWPFAKIARRQAVIDVATKTMRVAYTLDPGTKARFGPLTVEGLSRLEQRYVERRVGWKAGALYDQSKVDDTRQTLVTSGLFGEVTVGPDGPVAADGTVPMRIKLVERPVRSVGFGLAYDTSLGPEGNISWEHRNLFGYGEDLLVTALGGPSDSGLDIKFRRPDAIWFQQDFVAEISGNNELVNAFRELDQIVKVGFEQHFAADLTGGYALEAEHARINEIADTRVYTLVGVPLTLREDATDNLLNPTTGYRAGLEVTPYLRALGSELTYVQGQVTGSTYRKLDVAGTYVLAVQGTLGATCCASLDAIPKDHRLFAGGGGSVRGFGFQKAGPWDIYDNPIGGRSLLVGTVELRTRITDTIGLVPFLDAGNDYPTPLPKLDSKVYVGAGIGLRYFTAIGPLRLDLATPVNAHPVGDSPIQIYVSIGQAF